MIARLLPSRADVPDIRSTWRADLVAGLTVGVVALPLALGFGITSGLGARAGLITAIVAGLVAAVFGGSNLQVSGPTGAMTVVLVPLVERHGAGAIATVAFVAGILIVVAAVARVGRALAYVPWPVVEGFTVGIAVIIFLQQVPAALGVPRPHGENAAVVAGRATADAWGALSWETLALVVLVTGAMAVLPRLQRRLPASLVAILVATVVADVLGWDVATIGALPDSLPAPALPGLGAVPDLFSAALAVAALASIESLLSAKVADGMTDLAPHDPDRELFGQGLANVASSLFGGMPATGAIARTAVNARAGARTRAAAGVHAVVLLAVVLFGGSIVGRIPIAALAGVLMVTALRMVEVHNVRAVVRATRSDALIFAATALATVVFDLVVAVEIGIAVAAVLALRHVARSAGITSESLPVEVVPSDEHRLLAERILIYRLDGPLFFGAAQRFLTELTAVSDVRVVILRFSGVRVLDATAANALGEIVSELQGRGITVLLKGVRPEHRRILAAVGVVETLGGGHHLFDDLPVAVEHARVHVTRGA